MGLVLNCLSKSDLRCMLFKNYTPNKKVKFTRLCNPVNITNGKNKMLAAAIQKSFKIISSIQYSAIAVIVKNGFTPIVPGTREPSIAYKFLYPLTLP